MNPVITTGAAVLALAALLALAHVPLGTWIHRVFTDERDWRVERPSTASSASTRDRAALDRLRRSRCVAFAVVSVVALFAADRVQGCAAVVAGPVDGLAHRLQHGGLVRDEHELAVVCRRGRHRLHRAGRGPGRAELRLRRGRARGRDRRWSAASRASSTDRIGNFWVDLVRGTAAHPAAAGGRRGDRAARRWRHPEPHRPDHDHDRSPAARRSCRAARSPRRRRSRSSAPTAAASSTPTPPTRSRTPPPGPTCSRSSCCSPSRSRCRAPTA